MSPEEFQGRLEEISAALLGSLQNLHKRQDDFFTEASKMAGHIALSDAFKALIIESVGLLNKDIFPKIQEPLSEFYPQFLPRLVNSFQSVCGAEVAAMKGYPLQGYSILRNTFDDLVLTSAALQGFTDFYSIEGVVPGEALDLKDVKKLRKDTEFEVCRIMVGSKSGMSQLTIEHLEKLNELYDYEVHGARLSVALGAQDWMKQKGVLPVLPNFTELHFGLFMNRFSEVTWMIHRLLPMLQPEGIGFLEAWKDQWRTIDESFSIVAEAMTKELDKPIGDAIIEFVNVKFPFNEATEFPI